MFVVDASVVVKWFVPEHDSDKATALLKEDRKLIAPELIQIEVAGALTRLSRMKLLSTEMVTVLLKDWNTYLAQQTITLEATKTDIEAAISYSVKLEHQIQDCLYLAAAKRLGIPLITSDEKLLKKASASGCVVHSLESVSLTSPVVSNLH